MTWNELRGLTCNKMRQRLSKWAKANFTKDSLPSANTLRRMAINGEIPGAFQDNRRYWWVELEHNTIAARAVAAIEALPPELRDAAQAV